MSTRRRSRIARRSARLSCARMSSALARSSCPVSPPICRSISFTIRWVDSFWRSRLVSSSFTSWTLSRSASRWRSSRSRSALISSSRRRLSSRSAPGRPCAAAAAGRIAWSTSQRARLPRLHILEVPPHAHQTPAQAEQHAEEHEEGDLLRLEEHQAGQGADVAVAEEAEPGVAERDGEEPAQEPLEGALQQER